jgi:ADP-heptose:LPS heptosyltransferase
MAVPDRQSPRILIVRRDNIGDLACTTPLIAALRARHPKAWLGALVNTYNAEVLARNPALDSVFAYEKLKHRSGGLLATMFETMKLMSRLRGERLDYVLVPSATPRALRIAAGLRPERVLASDPAALPGKHEVERAFFLASPLGVSGRPGPMAVYPDPTVVEKLRKDISSTGKITAVHISARRPAQRWPIDRYVQLVSELRKTNPVLLLWAPGPKSDPRHPGDDEAAREIAAQTGCKALPTPDLATLIAALSLSSEVICPDGGAMHLAAALGKPIVALFGDSPVERWRPWGVPHRVVQPASKNLADLAVAEVLEAFAAL